MPVDAIMEPLWSGLLRWFDYYPVALALGELLSLWRPAHYLRRLATLNLIAAGLGLFWLLLCAYELLCAWYSQVEFVQFSLINRAVGPYWWAYWAGALPLLLSQLLWWRRLRRSFRCSFALALLLLCRPVLELVLVVFASTLRDYLPSSWAMLSPDALPRLLLGFGALGLLVWLRSRRTK